MMIAHFCVNFTKPNTSKIYSKASVLLVRDLFPAFQPLKGAQLSDNPRTNMAAALERTGASTTACSDCKS